MRQYQTKYYTFGARSIKKHKIYFEHVMHFQTHLKSARGIATPSQEGTTKKKVKHRILRETNLPSLKRFYDGTFCRLQHIFYFTPCLLHCQSMSMYRSLEKCHRGCSQIFPNPDWLYCLFYILGFLS